MEIFLVRLVREGFYQYDPANLSWPNLVLLLSRDPMDHKNYYLVPPFRDNHGSDDINIRLVTVSSVWARSFWCLCYDGDWERVATLSAALLLAVSPGAVYLSRYFITNRCLSFFTLGIVVALHLGVLTRGGPVI
jgi:hypothetical protein